MAAQTALVKDGFGFRPSTYPAQMSPWPLNVVKCVEQVEDKVVLTEVDKQHDEDSIDVLHPGELE